MGYYMNTRFIIIYQAILLSRNNNVAKNECALTKFL